MGRHLRSTYRALVGLPFLAVTLGIMLPLQELLVGSVFKNHSLFSNWVTGGFRRLFGLRVEFNKVSKPIEHNKQAWYVANHMSLADPFVIDKITRNKRFVAAGWLRTLPILNIVGKAARILFVSQKKEDEHKLKDRGSITEAFNEGRNVVMFPEGWTNDGATVEMFRAGLAEILYGADATDKKGNPVALENKDIVVQPIAIRVKSVDGVDAFDKPELREAYSMHAVKGNLKRVWSLMGYDEIVLDVTALDPLEPQNFASAKDLMNEAHRQIVKIVAPDQKDVSKAPIPAAEGEDRTARPIDNNGPK